jgi:hypothetical protein
VTLTQLVYASRSRLVEAERSVEIPRILASARRLNELNGITGFLLVTPGGFAQILEGEGDSVVETYGRIMADPRHGDLRLLQQAEVMERRFAGWTMGMAERDPTTEFIFGLYGISADADIFDQPLDTIVDLAGQLAAHPA